jgi:hypothetical protein
MKLYSYLASDFIDDSKIYNNIRRVSAVFQTLHTLKYYYWVVDPLDRSGVIPKAKEGSRPTREQVLQLRAKMLTYVRKLVIKEPGVQDDELQALLNYLTTLHEDSNVLDVLQLLVQLMAEHPQSMVPAFDRKSGIRYANSQTCFFSV